MLQFTHQFHHVLQCCMGCVVHTLSCNEPSLIALCLSSLSQVQMVDINPPRACAAAGGGLMLTISMKRKRAPSQQSDIELLHSYEPWVVVRFVLLLVFVIVLVLYARPTKAMGAHIGLVAAVQFGGFLVTTCFLGNQPEAAVMWNTVCVCMACTA